MRFRVSGVYRVMYAVDYATRRVEIAAADHRGRVDKLGPEGYARLTPRR